jgi:DNA repair exonuclease SbcCD ATPase subunit
MVAMGIDRSELASRVRGLFKGLNRSEVAGLDREGFARAIGVDPLSIPTEYKRELARILYNEFKLPYRKICGLLAMSARDVAKAVKSGVEAGEAVEGASAPKVDVEVQAKAIELVRSDEARNPNDLVLKLRIPLEVAEQLFNRVVENEKLTLESTVNAVVRIERSLRSISRYAERVGDLEGKVKGYEERAQRIIEELDKALNDRMKMIQYAKKQVEGLGKEVSELGIILAGMGVEVRTFKDLLGRLQQLKDEVSKLNGDLGKLREEVEVMDRRLLSVATEVGRLEELKEKVEKLVKAR